MKTHCTALDAAEAILDWHFRHGCGISNLRLNLLLYFVQAYFLVKSKGSEACFPEDIEARSYGPVVPEAFSKYSCYGSLDIPFIPNEKVKVNAKDREMIESVAECFKVYSLLDLRDLALSQKPWQTAFNPCCTMRIRNELIAEWFLAG